MKPVILYRRIDQSENESEAMKRYFNVVHQRALIPSDSLVFGRYSVLPFYKELEKDVNLLGSKMLIPYSEHRFIADLKEWYSVLGPEITPRTWDRLESLPEKGPFILKGETNSKKDQWKELMYAETKRDAVRIYLKLQEDSLIGQQKIYIREFVKLKTFFNSINGMPVTEEYRCFCYNGEILCSSFYWSSFSDEVGPKILPHNAAEYIENLVLPELSPYCKFVVVDIGIKENCEPIVIELNDPQMSGLSLIDPNEFYFELNHKLK